MNILDQEVGEKMDSLPTRITNDEWLDIALSLENYHAVFYKIWQMGKPHFIEDIETAAVQFDETGNFVWFLFNPRFWASLDHYNKLFVICHEALHVILNHGIRTTSIARINKGACNAALDIVVNHNLLRNFGFERKKIINAEKLCWIDTVFKDKNPPDNEMFEYYYNLFEKVYGDGGRGDGKSCGDNSMGSMAGGTVDDHSMMGDTDKAIEELNESLNEEEKASLKDMIDKHHENESKDKKAGTGTGNWTFANVGKVKKKKKWETVIKKWASKYLKTNEKEIEQWARLNRRLTMLPRDMFLPSDMEIEEIENEKVRIKVFFFLDTSGSCYHLKDRFFTAAMSLPEEKFDIRLFCFDTTVQETTIESKKIYGGGGTAFDIIEKFIQQDIQKNGETPSGIFIITDGWGNAVKPQQPDKWYWFLTAGGSKQYISKESKVYNLDNFE